MDSRLEAMLGDWGESMMSANTLLRQEKAALEKRLEESRTAEAPSRPPAELVLRCNDLQAAINCLDRLDDEGEEGERLRPQRMEKVREVLSRFLEENRPPPQTAESTPPISLGSRKVGA
jgi:hypothetical protein